MFYQVGKRLIDILAGIAGLLWCGLVFLPVALAIRLESPGPVLFGQERLGKGKKPFRCYKFRTMYTTEAENKYKPLTDDDDRVTRVGSILRQWSLDELPQFWNIFIGDMSFVGPRPELDYFVSQYEDWQHRRFEAKPGLTGWWQVNGRKQPMHAYIQEDIYYIEHQSLRLDMEIIIRTVGAVVTRKGAY